MKLAKDNETLWVAERRGTAVYSRRGRAGTSPIPKAKPFANEAKAEAFLAAEIAKQLAAGFVIVDPDAKLDDPFTLDGARTVSAPPDFGAKHAGLVDTLRTHVLGGFTARDDMDRVLADLDHQKTPGLRGKLERQLAIEYEAARRRPRPEPCVNEAIDRAFAALDARDIVALQHAGFTQSDGWSDINLVAEQWRVRGRPSRGGCFYHFQDLERAVHDKGLLLGFGTFGERAGRVDADRALAAEIVEVLCAHGVPASWDGDPAKRIAIAPFPWWRPLT